MTQLKPGSALQSQKLWLIGRVIDMHSALCSHALPALRNSWTHDAAWQHTIIPVS